MIITLVGFMAAGKTSVGKLLAKKLDYKFIDLDQYIERLTQNSIRKIFSAKGEKQFRRLEKKLLKKLIEKHEDLIISPGGGIVIDQDNIDLIKEKTMPFYLKASPDTIVNRLGEISDRPLIDQNNPKKAVDELLKKREYLYNQFNNIIRTDNMNLEEVTDEIFYKLDKLN
ncbi:MAG: shikimate kinase [Halanaerobiales bacterium]|nr:shikimate kinase [Halanaerobiales bacterium]